MEYVLRAINERHSTRCFCDRVISDTLINKLINAATRAPSGRNSQPWGFSIIKDNSVIKDLSRLMRHSRFISKASCIIAVYRIKERCYDFEKDCMAIGAAIQNMLLCAQESGLGTCWVAENIDKAEELLTDNYILDGCVLMSLVAVGYKDRNAIEKKTPKVLRKPVYLIRRKQNELQEEL